MASRKKEEHPPEPPPTEEELETASLELSSSSLEMEAVSKLKPDEMKKLKKIAYYTAKVGLPLNEACTLVNIDYDQFVEDMKLEPVIGKIIRAKELEYKKDLLLTISRKARAGDDKQAQWLLERRYPDEYGDKKKGQSTDPGDVIFEAIRFIRKNGDSKPLVHEMTSAPVHLPNASHKPIEARIDDILNNPQPQHG